MMFTHCKGQYLRGNKLQLGCLQANAAVLARELAFFAVLEKTYTMHATSIFACLLLLALIARVEAQQPQRKGRYAIGVNYPAHMYYIPKVQQLPSSFPTHEPKHTTPRQATASPLKLLRGLPCGTAAWEFRTFDGQCNNLQRPSLGSSNTGQLLHKRRTSSRPSGQNRPNARFISNTLSRQVIEDKPNRRGMSEFLTFFGQVRQKHKLLFQCLELLLDSGWNCYRNVPF